MRTQQAGLTGPRIELRVSELERHLKRRKLHSVHARADFIGVHRSTIERLTDGTHLPSEWFIARVLAAFKDELKFEDLFKLVVPSTKRAPAHAGTSTRGDAAQQGQP